MKRALLFLLVACQSGLSEPKPLPPLDEAYFRCRVQPVLTKSCAAFACHGDARRYFHVFARNRLRLQGTEKDRNLALSDVERAANFEAARAFAEGDAPLTIKPLTSSGAYHRGAEIFGGGNVFATTDDPDWKTLDDWIHGAKEDPKCIEPGSDQ
jgi:hypothetical protein